MPDQVVRSGAAAQDWTVRAADSIESVVGVVRDKAVEPIQKATRYIVFGLVITLVGSLTVVMLCAGLVRVIDIGWTDLLHNHRVWRAHASLGGIFLVAGLVVYRWRTPRKKS